MSKGYTFISWKPKGKGRPSSDHICIAGSSETLCEIAVPGDKAVVTRGTTRATKKDCDVCRIVMRHIDRVTATKPVTTIKAKAPAKTKKAEPVTA